MSEEQQKSKENAWGIEAGTEVETLVNKKNWGSIGEMAASYTNLEKLMGGSSNVVALPDWNNTEEASKFYNLLGRPEKFDDFKFDKAENDDGSYDIYRQAAYDQGLNPKQAKGIYDKFNEGVLKQQEAFLKEFEANKQAAEHDLKEEWGNEYNTKMDNAKRAFKEIGLEPEKAEELSVILGLKDTQKLFSALGGITQEASFIGSEKSGTNIDSLNDQIAEIQNNPKYMVAGENQELVTKMENLMKALTVQKETV